jgi:hypothetical protein
MKAMLEPRIVAVRIQGAELLAQGVPGVPERINDSSHGVFI